jgi:hypothetical protein
MGSTFATKTELHNISQIAHISRLEYTARELTASDHVDFLLGCRRPIHSAHIWHCKQGDAHGFIITIAKVCAAFSLQHLDKNQVGVNAFF